jgi:hypothetical protein
VRSNLVVLATRDVEHWLLFPQIGLRWLGRLRLERAMEAFLATVLSRFPGVMRSTRMPSRIHPTDSFVRPPAPTEANGGPLSETNRPGSPNSWKAESNIRCTSFPSGSTTHPVAVAPVTSENGRRPAFVLRRFRSFRCVIPRRERTMRSSSSSETFDGLVSGLRERASATRMSCCASR